MKYFKILALFVALLTAVSCMGIHAFAETGSADLDLTANQSVSIAQTYTLTVEEVHCIETSKIKVEWTVAPIAETRNEEKVWNSADLVWDEKDSAAENDYVATFQFTNYSPEKVGASVSFQAEDALRNTLKSVNYTNDGTKENGTDASTSIITATLSIDAEKVAKQNSETKYGTYTVKIVKMNDSF